MTRRTTHKFASLSIVCLMTLVLFPIANAEEDVRVGDAQKAALESKFGAGAPFGTVGKMLEEVNLYLHSDDLGPGFAGWNQAMAESVAGGTPPANSPDYVQAIDPIADFARPSKYKTVDVMVTPVIPGFDADEAWALGDTDTDAYNKRVRLGWIDPVIQAAEIDAACTEYDLAPVPATTAPCVKGVDTNYQTSFFTPADLTADADFRIYDIGSYVYAQCGVVTNGVWAADPNLVGDLIVSVFRVDSDGNRIDANTAVAGVDAVTSFRLANQGPFSSPFDETSLPTGYAGSYLQTDDLGNGPAVPNFFLDGGMFVKKGERLEFRFGLQALTFGQPATFQGQLHLQDSEAGVPLDATCFLHYDTLRDTKSYYSDFTDEWSGKGPTTTPIPVHDGTGYESRMWVKGDTLRVSTWISDADGRLAVGLGDGDRFNVDTAFMSAWGSLARDDFLDYQPYALDKRLGSRFRYSDTQEIIAFELTGSEKITVDSDSILAKRASYQFAPGEKRKAPFNTEIYLAQDLNLRDQQFRGIQFAKSGDVFIGKTGMNFFLSENENALHEVNPGEPTVFSYSVENLGSSFDTITIAADPMGGGWTAEVLNPLQTVGGGGSAIVNVKVTPPSGATSGTSPALRVRAISSFVDIIEPQQAEDAHVTITSTVKRGLDFVPAATEVNIAPRGERIVGLSLRNTGTAVDHYTVSTSVPNLVTGWNVRMSPTGREIISGATGEFQLTINAPADAPANLEFPLTIKAVRVGDNAVSETVVVIVKVVGAYGLKIDPQTPSNTMALRHWGGNSQEGPFEYDSVAVRDIIGEPVDPADADPVPVGAVYGASNPSGCAGIPVQLVGEQDPAGSGVPLMVFSEDSACYSIDQDTEQSPTVMFPIILQSTGSLDDQIVITRNHISGNFGGTAAGNWVYRVGEQGSLESASTTGNSNVGMTVPLEAGETKTVYFELLPNNRAAFTDVEIALTFSSKNDGSIVRGPVTLHVDAIDAGSHISKTHYSTQVHRVAVYEEFGQELSGATLPGGTQEYLFRVANFGNEEDTLVVRANQLPTGWQQTLTPVGGPYSFSTGDCTATALRVTCPDVLAGEEILLSLKVSPGSTIPVGDFVRSLVSVTSQESGDKTDSIEFLTTATGTHVFDVEALDQRLDVTVGQSALFPFTIYNQGTDGDDYTLSLLSGDTAFKPRFSVTDSVFVPAGHTLHGFFAVTAPTGAVVGTAVPFTVQFESAGSGDVDKLDYFVTPVAASNLRLAGEPGNSVLITDRGVETTFSVKVTDLSGGTGKTVTVSRDTASIPDDWIVTPASKTVTLANNAGATSAVATFNVTAPLDSLGTTRLPVRFNGVSNHATPLRGFTDMVFELASESGLSIAAPLGDNSTITAGAEEIYSLVVRNTGLGNDNVTMSANGVPVGWTSSFNPAQVRLGPLEAQTVEYHLKSPITASPKSAAAVTVFATGSSGALAQKTLVTTIGFFGVDVTTEQPNLVGAPAETLSHIVTLSNEGSVEDDYSVNATVASAAYAGLVQLTVSEPAIRDLAAGAGQDVQIDWVIDPSVPTGVTIPVTVTAKSLGDVTQISSVTLRVRLVDFVLQDADLDGVKELAIDRDEDTSNGYEEYKEVDVDAGKVSFLVDPTAFFDEAAVEAYSVEVTDEDGNVSDVVEYFLDGDGDGRYDHFLDSNGDRLPDRYWDPDSEAASAINLRRDVSGDDIPDLFVDLDADGDLDAVYNLISGKWIDLVVRDIDSDGQLDYLVDTNGNGVVDEDETVVYGKDGKLLTVQRLDMDGDGKFDEVYDTDGDGRPDEFIPYGSTQSIPIELRDMNGDGILDWAYDANGDGTLDSYYDPATGDVSMVDSEGVFVDTLLDYWYVAAIFLVVSGLFIALLIVTRR